MGEDSPSEAPAASCNAVGKTGDKECQNGGSNIPVTRSIFDLMKEVDEREKEIEKLKESRVLPKTTVLDLPDKVLISFKKLFI